MLLTRICVCSLQHKNVRNIGQQLLDLYFTPCSNMAVSLALLQSFVTSPSSKLLLTTAVRSGSVSSASFFTQGNPISGYRRLRDFGGKQMMSSSDSVCTYPLLMIKKVLLEDKQRNLYFLS